MITDDELATIDNHLTRGQLGPEYEPEFCEAAFHDIPALLREVRELREIVAKLEKTADGVPVVPDMVLFCPNGHKHNEQDFPREIYCMKGECLIEGCQGDSDSGTHHLYRHCYSTESAALAARKEGGANG